MGRPLPGYDVVLLDADGSPADEGEVSIRLDPRPVGLMDRYSGDPSEAIAQAGDIYYRTGDVARRDGEGYFWYIGRADDLFKSSDYRLSPFELESVVIEHPAIGRGGGCAQPRSPASCGTEVLRRPENRLQRDARARRRHLRASASTAGPLRAHPSTRIRRHSQDDLGKDPAEGASAARSQTTCSQRERGARIRRRRDRKRRAVPGHLQRVSGRHQSLEPRSVHDRCEPRLLRDVRLYARGGDRKIPSFGGGPRTHGRITRAHTQDPRRRVVSDRDDSHPQER